MRSVYTCVLSAGSLDEPRVTFYTCCWSVWTTVGSKWRLLFIKGSAPNAASYPRHSVRRWRNKTPPWISKHSDFCLTGNSKIPVRLKALYRWPARINIQVKQSQNDSEVRRQQLGVKKKKKSVSKTAVPIFKVNPQEKMEKKWNPRSFGRSLFASAQENSCQNGLHSTWTVAERLAVPHSRLWVRFQALGLSVLPVCWLLTSISSFLSRVSPCLHLETTGFCKHLEPSTGDNGIKITASSRCFVLRFEACWMLCAFPFSLGNGREAAGLGRQPLTGMEAVRFRWSVWKLVIVIHPAVSICTTLGRSVDFWRGKKDLRDFRFDFSSQNPLAALITITQRWIKCEERRAKLWKDVRIWFRLYDPSTRFP